MAYSVKMLLDSISPAGRRLTTWELTYPRMVHAELMTHRLFSRNSASSRAIPSEKMLASIEQDPAMPVFWGKNQKGMQAAEELSDERDYSQKACRRHLVGGNFARDRCEDCEHQARNGSPSPREQAKAIWLRLRDQAVAGARELAALGLHKQLCNRPTEPWMFITVIVSATTFDNWYRLRDHWQAQPEIAWVAREMHKQSEVNKPKLLDAGQWHLPLVEEEDWVKAREIVGAASPGSVKGRDYAALLALKAVSTGRVARVSLLNHDGKRDLADDLALHDRLLAGQEKGDPLHMSPFEHVAQALADPNEQSGNFRGWKQYRKEIKGEHFGEVLP